MASETIACSDATLEEFLERSRTLTVNHLPAPQDPDAETAAGIVSYDHIESLRIKQSNLHGHLQNSMTGNRVILCIG